MVNLAAQGRIGQPFVVEVERGKIIEFAHSVFSNNPAYLDDPNPVMPPTFLTVALFWQEWAGGDANPWSYVEVDRARGLHAEQEYIFHGPPPRAGTTLTGQSRIAEIYTKQGRRGGELTFAVMVTEFRDETGRLVAEARLTGVETARAPQPDASTASDT